jgi:hypothetical protein
MPIIKAHRLPPPDTLSAWRAKHSQLCRRQWLDVTIGIWAHWRCSCGSKFIELAERAS